MNISVNDTIRSSIIRQSICGKSCTEIYHNLQVCFIESNLSLKVSFY